jgi:predicted aspartyl protease
LLKGLVNARLEPFVDISLRGPLSEVSLPVLLDTGFTGFLKLDKELADHIGIKRTLITRVVLANGATDTVDLGIVEIWWRKRWRRELAMIAPGGSMVGTALLGGTVMRVRVVPGGSVKIRP